MMYVSASALDMMPPHVLALRDDIATLKALIANRDDTIAKRAEQIAALAHDLEVFRRMLLGRSSGKRRA